jgi:hypothetical protein
MDTRLFLMKASRARSVIFTFLVVPICKNRMNRITFRGNFLVSGMKSAAGQELTSCIFHTPALRAWLGLMAGITRAGKYPEPESGNLGFLFLRRRRLMLEL